MYACVQMHGMHLYGHNTRRYIILHTFDMHAYRKKNDISHMYMHTYTKYLFHITHIHTYNKNVLHILIGEALQYVLRAYEMCSNSFAVLCWR